jgi:hypothetical protein
MTTTNKPKTLFWIIAIIALLWNLMGLFQFIAATFMQDLIAEGISEQELNLINNVPSWYTVFFGISTIAGFLACVTMLIRKKVTVFLFLLSLIGVLVSQGYWILGTDAMEVVGNQAIIMPLVVIIISFFLYFYTKSASKKGWIH